MNYRYKAQVLRVVDGDSLHMKVFLTQSVDYGFRLIEDTPEKTMKLPFRLAGIDCPEKKDDYPAWLVAKDHLTYLLGDGDVEIETHKDPGNFGRWLCVIYKNGINVNEQMVKDGHAVERQW